MSGMFTNGMPLASIANGNTLPLTGNETLPVDTNLTAGSGPETVALSTAQLGLAGSFALTSAATVALTGGTNSARKMTLTMTQNTTFTAPTNGADFTLILTQDATGSRTGTFPASFLFVGGSKTLTTTANAIDTITGIFNPVTGQWLCSLLKAYA